MTNDIDTPGELGSFLVANRIVIYLGGVAVIALPLVLHNAAGVTVSRSARLGITVAMVGLMVATYLAELRLGTDVDDGGSAGSTSSGGYPLRTQIAVGAAVLGLALGVYVGLEVSWLAGLLFVAGAYFFAYMAYEGDGGTR